MSTDVIIALVIGLVVGLVFGVGFVMFLGYAFNQGKISASKDKPE